MSTTTLNLPSPVRTTSLGTALLAIGSGLGLFLVHEGAQRTGELRLDEYLSVDREAPLVWAARAIDFLLSPGIGLLIVALACLTLVMRRHWAAAIAMLAVTGSGWAVVGVGKILFARQRPPAALVRALIHESGATSFPSGHTAIAAGLLAGLLVALRVSGRSTRRAWLIGVPVVLGVALSRLYLGVHYLGDVVASNLFVAGTTLVLVGVAAALTRSSRIARLLSRS